MAKAVPSARYISRSATIDARLRSIVCWVSGITSGWKLIGAFGHALTRAAAIALDWGEPLVARARLAGDLAWSALIAERPDTAAARRHFAAGLEHASRAIDRDPNDADGFEARGFLAHRMEATLPPGSVERAELLVTARTDLERAVALDRERVRAWSLLSNLAFREADFARAFWLATTAYEVHPDHPHAREVLDELDAGGPGALRPRLEMMVASVIAGAALADSAEAVVQRATRRGEEDPELLHLEAHVRTVLGQRDTAAALLDRWVELNPSANGFMVRSRRFSAVHPPVAGH